LLIVSHVVCSISDKICCIYLAVTGLLQRGCGLTVAGIADDLARCKRECVGAIGPLFPYLMERFISAAVYSVKIVTLIAETISQCLGYGRKIK
jgi:hypothetical protein